MSQGSVLQRAREAFSAVISRHGLGDDPVRVTAEPLSAQQALGRVQRQDFPLLEGREVMIEAEFRGSFGQAFTDQPRSFRGSMKDVQALDLGFNADRAIFVSTLNAVTCYLGMVERTRHCRNDEPERCGSEIAHRLFSEFGKVRVGLVGYQPAILENLTLAFGAESVRCSDLSPKNIGFRRFGLEIWDGKAKTSNLIDWSQLLLVTSSVIVNGSFDDIHERAVTSQGKPLVLFGISGAGVAELLGLRRLCLYGS